MTALRLKDCGIFRNILIFNVILVSFSMLVNGNKTEVTSTTPEVTTTTTTTSSTTTNPIIPNVQASGTEAQTLSALNLLQLASHPAFKLEVPQTLTDFIRSMMKKYGEVKAAEAFQSLDQLPLGLIMKILLVEVDKNLAADIVEMQRYAQSQDKTVIMMIGKIVAGDKNVPKEIFAMDQKLMKFPWWMRIRQRMFSNLEKYVAAYSLVPTAAKTATKSVKNLETSSLGVPLPKSELASAVAASATEAYIINPAQVSQASDASSSTTSTITPVPLEQDPAASSVNVEQTPSTLSLLNPIQQQQVLETLALAKAAAAAQQQAQQLLQFQQLQQQQQQQPQQTNFNPLAFLLG